MGAASAAEDISTDSVDAIADDAISVDAVQDEISDSTNLEKPILTANASDDTSIEDTDEGTKTDKTIDESAKVDSEQTRTTTKHVSTWNDFETYCESFDDDYVIYLDSVITYDSDFIEFGNSATIIGTPNNYITGGNSGKTIFKSSGDLNITFENVTFKNMNAWVLMQLSTSGHNRFINCSFDNIHTYSFRSSVIWNNGGWMTISGCNFTNCYNSFGVITNHLTYNTVFMNVEDCRFENNYGSYEPGAINNCGMMNVTNCIFNNNSAAQWAGAIHTHSNAHTRIVGSNFTNNVAGTNGGALFSYSKLEVFNSTFIGNIATNNGGAICGYSYGSTYNITVENSNFINNKVTNGLGGAIRAMNLGYLNVSYSNFTNNQASNGQAISGITETITYCNCENCTCDDCPNCINCTHYISNESANLKLYNNIYLNHTGENDTVTISGNEYIFNYNVFINSTQKTVYNGTGNKYNLTTYPNPIFAQSLSKSILGTSVLYDSEGNDEIFVNYSKSDSGDGSSWDEAYSKGNFNNAMNDIANGGTIYLAPSEEKYSANIGKSKNFTIMGFDRENTNVLLQRIKDYDMLGTHNKLILINLTFSTPRNANLELLDDLEFINCTFKNKITTTKDIYNDYISNPVIVSNFDDSFVINFTECEFKDFEATGSIIEAFRYSQINFKNCTFENINANSIVNNTGDFTFSDAINFYDCTFTNVNIKGLVDVPEGTEIGAEEGSRVHIEGCTGLAEGEPLVDSGRMYVNTTQSRTETVLVLDIDEDGCLVISLTDVGGEPIAYDSIFISVNDEEATPYELEEDGTLTVPIIDLTDSTGKLNITVTFEDTDDYKGSSADISTVLVINDVYIEPYAVISISKEDDELVISLLDDEGDPIVDADVIVTVDGENVDVEKTDENGEISLAIDKNSTIVASYTDENDITVTASMVIIYETEELIEQINDLKDQVEELTENLTQAESDLDDANAQVENLSSQVSDLKDDLAQAQSDLAAATEDLIELTENLTQAQTDLADANDKVDNLTSQVKDLSDELADAKTDLADANAKVDNLTSQVDELSDELIDAQSDLAAANDQVANLSSELSALNETVASQDALISDLNETVANQSATIASQAKTVDELNASVADLNTKVDDLLKIIDELNKTTELNHTVTKIIYENMTTTSVSSLDGRVGKYFVVQLVDADGKALANKAVQIGFNGKIYNKTTDENGSAKLQINLAAKGTYTFAIAYLGDDKYNGSFEVAKIVVTPQTPKLTTSSKTYKATAKTKTLTATFKTVNGNPIKGKKISFTVNGKTYTGTTNANGVASVNVSLSKKGTYSFTAKYAGDSIYGAVSKSSKLIIK